MTPPGVRGLRVVDTRCRRLGCAQALGLRPWLAALLLRLWRLRDRLLIEGSSLRRAVVRRRAISR